MEDSGTHVVDQDPEILAISGTPVIIEPVESVVVVNLLMPCNHVVELPSEFSPTDPT